MHPFVPRLAALILTGHNMLEYSPFSIDDAPVDGPLSNAYEVLDQLTSLIHDHRGKPAMVGVRPSLDSDGSMERTLQTV